MSGYFDARCWKCGVRIGWQGELKDAPRCHKCGAEPDRKALAEDQAKMDEAERLMLLHPRDAKPRDLQQQRVQAGLTLRQAAGQLGVEARLIADCENGRCELPAELAQKMAECYQCGRSNA